LRKITDHVPSAQHIVCKAQEFAMHYQHPELEIVRAALDYDVAAGIAETGA
jgi:hypothetical protein